MNLQVRHLHDILKRYRALEDKQASGWYESEGSVCLGQPEHGFRVLSATTPRDEIADCQRKFEVFVENSQSWPETANIQTSWTTRHIVEDAVIRRLETIV